MRTHVYIDAFNLYFGALKDTPYKWLDVATLCRLLLPGQQIQKIKYFTAHLHARPSEPGQPALQQTYLRALRTLPYVEIILGHYLVHEVSMPLAGSSGGKQQYVRVIKTEEKGSEVNLATHLLVDAFKGEFECAVIVSNDSDLLAPLMVVRHELGKKVGVLNPHKKPARVLYKNATFVKPIRAGVLAALQFSSALVDEHGTFHKPSSW